MAPTPYMLFCNENRDAARQQLVAAGHEKIPVTLVAKELGQIWKALSDEERAAYKTRVEELQQQQQQQQQQAAADGSEQQGSPTGEQPATTEAKAGPATTVPTFWVKRLVGVDPEIQRCTADAVSALSMAADVFLGAMCAKAAAAAACAKRRTVRLDDVERCVRGDKRLAAVGMSAVLSMVAAAAEEGGQGGAKAAQPGNKKPRIEKPGGAVNNSIERAFGLAQQAS